MVVLNTLILRNERGVALPLVLMVLALLVSLTATLVALSATEPVISTNLKRADQALTLAEAGVERAVWALSPTPTGPAAFGVATPLLVAAGPPWDGSNLFTLTAAGDAAVVGGYTVQLTPGAKSNEVQVASSGWIPNNVNPAASRVVRVTLMSLAHRFRPPGALNVDGETSVSGNAAVSAFGDICNSTGPASGTYSAGTTNVGGDGQICAGASCSSTTTTCQSPSCLQSQPGAPATFNDLKFTPDELLMLKDLAKTAGTYWGPPNYQGASTGGTWNGMVNFDTSTPLPNGLIFVDTISGNAPSASNVSDLADVRLTGSGGTYNGWVIVMGSIDISGNKTYNGVIYAADDLTAGNGTAIINGAVVAHNVNQANNTQIDTSTNGTISINYDCNAINNGGGQIPQGFLVKPGTWREVSG
jgi:hypothetical protein